MIGADAKIRKHVAGLLIGLGALLGASASAAPASPPTAEERVQLAPSGKLRVAILTYDPALGSREAGGVPGGVAGDLARSLANAIGVPLQTTFYDLPQGFNQSIGSLSWDLAFTGRDVPGHVDFAATILLVEHELLLAPGRSFQDLADVDRDKVRVGVTMGTMDETFLGQRLRKAFIFRVLVGIDAASTTLRTSGADVFAGSVPFLSRVAAAVPGSRMLGPPYALAPVMATLAPGRSSARAYIADFIREAKTSGFIQQSINRAQLPGVSVAPP